VLIANSGQSVGKLVLGTRIIDAEGHTAGFFQGFVLRTLPVTLVALLPTLGLAVGLDVATAGVLAILAGLVSLVDCLLIFGAENRTLHDRIAGTYVCSVGTQRVLDEEQQAREEKRKKGGKKRKKRREVTSPE
jgi:uncharacterized RDD family membrane protein YckC